MTLDVTRRRESAAHLVDVDIDRASNVTIGRQIYLALRQAIVAGRTPPGARLPSTRVATALWKVSRGSVVEAYDMLLSEGYIEGRPGSGTYVAEDVPMRGRICRQNKATDATVGRVSRAAALMISTSALEPPPQVAFVPGRAALDEKSRAILTRLGHRHVGAASGVYGDPRGLPQLREAVATYLSAARGLRCDPERVIITSGAQQAIDLAARTLIDPGERVAIEDPSYPPARLAFSAIGAALTPIPVDGSGIRVDILQQSGVDIRAVYVTPSHQYPTGSALSMARRMALIDWAATTNAWILEDDYDSEFRYDERPLNALQGIDEHNRVIYIGTFSKALLPGLRLGYLVVPEALVSAFSSVRAVFDRFPATFHQLVVADFLTEGHFSSHLRRMRETYRTSRDMLFHFLQVRVSSHLKAELPKQGIHLLAEPLHDRADTEIAETTRRAGITLLPISPMSLLEKPRHGILLGFSALSERDADIATFRLAKVLSAI
ncbi:PLP-dependent aminotransferase family protein [Agrobacterium rhizogenes]|uniref:MocR-like pyridoxine biosynthesis transcription factor PdxR n=1 Tax=Rhizobium rhizogenes TaxID=359 RepID=UPI0022B74186|nr:PLP-dependent aminotransferase family protein [Rhizobium rhizogenes]MCZ7450817.1 PLP-dependent aminotransferase family protein [Rhizobium rhizogenes]